MSACTPTQSAARHSTAEWWDRASRLVAVVRAKPTTDSGRFAKAAAIAASLGAVPFLLVLGNFGFRPLRTALPTRYFSNFFDLQARAFLRGDLAIPDGALNFEAFRWDGREYIYFMPFPSLLRLPIMVLTNALDGRLTVFSMLLAWAMGVTFTALLVWRVRCMMRPGVPLARAELIAYSLVVGSVAGGSCFVYLAALPYVFHEALLWAASSAIGAIYAIIGVLEAATQRRIVAAGVLCLVAILSRATAGWACTFALMACAGLIVVHPRYRAVRSRWPAVFAAGFVPLAIGILVNYAKFRHPVMIPFETQVWTDLSEQRRRALAANGGSLFGPQYFPTTMMAYFRPDGIRFNSVFPFVTKPAEAAPEFGNAYFDMRYQAGSITSFMPLLTLPAIWGLVVVFRPRVPDGVARLRLPMLGAGAITGAVIFVAYVGHRYTAEFMPALVLACAAGIVDIARRWAKWRTRWRRGTLVVMGGLALFGAWANVAIGTIAARHYAGGDSLRGFVEMQMSVSSWTGDPLAGYVQPVSLLPRQSSPDQLRVVGDCKAVYVGTGDLYEPWVLVDAKGVEVEATVAGDDPFGRQALLTIEGVIDRVIEVESDGDGMYRLVVDGYPTNWHELSAGATIGVRVEPDPRTAVYFVSYFVGDEPASFIVGYPLAEWEEQLLNIPSLLRQGGTQTGPFKLDVGIATRWDETSSTCEDLSAMAR